MTKVTRFVPGSPKARKVLRDDIRDTLTDAYSRPIARFDGPLAVELAFVVERPAGTPTTMLTPAAVDKPNLHKLVCAVFDAITNASVWPDATAVVHVAATKRIAEPREPTCCLITIRDTFAISPAATDQDFTPGGNT